MSATADLTRALRGQQARHLVIVPACDEEAHLPVLLASLASQEPADGVALVVAANNCRDRTAALARRWARDHPALRAVVVERTDAVPNVGRVRRDVAAAAVAAGYRSLLFLDADARLAGPRVLRAVAAAADAATPAEDGAGCWVLSSDEFGDVREQTGTPADARDAVLAFGSAFRCRELPRVEPLFRFTSGTNTLVTCEAYDGCGGIEPRTVGSDSTLGERHLRHTGRLPAYLDAVVVPSARKHFARGTWGGFIFYPQQTTTLQAVRGGTPATPWRATLAECFQTVARDLRHFLLFLLLKREDWLRERGLGPRDLATRLAQAFEAFDSRKHSIVSVWAEGPDVRLRLHPGGGEERFRLGWDEARAFARSGR